MNHVDLLQQLADKLGLAINHLWPQAVRYVVVASAVRVAIGAALGLFAWFLYQKGKMQTGEDPLPKVILFILAACTGITALLLLSQITGVIEPEGQLVHQILKK